MTKVTLTLDALSLSRLEDASARLSMPKSEIVREAIVEFHDRIGRLSERERTALLRAFDDYIPQIPRRAASAVDAEIAAIRADRGVGGRATPPRGKS